MFRYPLESAYCKVWLSLLNISVVLRVFIEIISEELSDYEQMFLVVKEVVEFQEMLLIKIFTVSLDVSKQLDLIDTLVKVILIVLNDLHAHHLLSVDVIALNSF